MSYTYSSLDTRGGGGGADRKGKGPGEQETGGGRGHAYAPLSEKADGGDVGGSDSDAVAGKEEGGVVRLTSRHHIAIPISYFCIGFLGRCE